MSAAARATDGLAETAGLFYSFRFYQFKRLITMPMKSALLRCLGAGLLLLGLCSQAQNLDQAGVRLSPEERERLQAILDKPIDPGSLNTTRTLIYRQKDLAAFKLGLNAIREQNLREWAKFDVEGQWSLRGFLSGTEKRAEAFELGHRMIQSERWPPSAIRLRVYVAMDYLDDNNLPQTVRLMDEAENLIKSDLRNMPRRGDAVFWISRAEVEYHIAKSRFSMRTGKWEDGIQNARLAVEKASNLARLVSMAPSENAKVYAYGTMLFAYAELGSHQTASGQFAEAEWTMREAYKRTKEYGFPETTLQGFYNRVADYYNAVGLYPEAAKFGELSEKLVLAQGYETGSPMWLHARNRINTALIGADQWQQALKGYELIDQETARLGRQASGVHAQALLRGFVYIKNGLHDKALRHLQENMRVLTENFGPDHYFTATSRGMLASALWKAGQAAQARQEFEHAIRSMTAPSSLTGDFNETAVQQKVRRFVLQSYLQLLAQTAAQNPKDAETIFQLAEQLNVSKVQQALAEAAVRNGVNVPGLSDIIRKEQDAKNEIASLTAYISGQTTEDERHRTPQVVEQMRFRLREIEKERREYKAQIQKSYPEYFQLIQPKAPSTQDVAKQLQPDELFMTIIALEDKSYVWAIEPNGKVRFHAADLPEAQVKNLVTRLRKTLDVAALGSRAPAFDVVSGHQLYQQLLAPFEEAMRNSRHLIVATSGQLAQLPFAVLPRRPDPAQPAWLIRDIAISHVPTANGWLSLKRLSSQPAAPQALLAWGDPAFDANAAQVAAAGGSTVRAVPVTRTLEGHARNIMDASTYVNYSKIPPLPETRDEVLQLAKILQADPRQDLVLGPEATRASVLKHSSSGQLAKKQVVVFATHGLLAGDLPNLNQPALAMAASKNLNESPLLTLEDVLGLRLNADWVVLSACNTAGADGKAEEAMSGLARGFFYAGSRSLLVTHWSVESESAMQLTTRTFSAYKSQPNLRRAEALRQSMLAVMDTPQYSHPTYWAPYALVGEGGR